MGSSEPGRFHLPEHELTWRFSRSSGPGGQHVNTTDTRVELLWPIDASTALTDAQKSAISNRLKNRIVDGTITVVSSDYRSQHRNREAARVRLEQLVAAALVPRKKRHSTRPSRGSVERRLKAKKQRSQTKRDRGAGWD